MKSAFLSMVIAGTAIGVMLPGAKKPAAAPVAAAAAARPIATVLTREDNGHFYTAADVNGHGIRFVVDTGATGVALTVEDARTAGIAVDRAQFEPVGTGAGGAVYGQRIHVRLLELEDRKVEDLTAVVIDGLTISLLGQAYLQTLDSVEIKGDTMTLR